MKFKKALPTILAATCCTCLTGAREVGTSNEIDNIDLDKFDKPEEIYINKIKSSQSDKMYDHDKFWIIAGGVAGVTLLGGYVCGRIYSSKQKKKRKKEIERRKKELENLKFGEIKDIATPLLEIIPISEYGNSTFDALLKCKSDKDMREWIGIKVANSSWDWETLIKIKHVLETKHIDCKILEQLIEMTNRKEIEQQKIATNSTPYNNHFYISWDKETGLRPGFVF